MHSIELVDEHVAGQGGREKREVFLFFVFVYPFGHGLC